MFVPCIATHTYIYSCIAFKVSEGREGKGREGGGVYVRISVGVLISLCRGQGVHLTWNSVQNLIVHCSYMNSLMY